MKNVVNIVQFVREYACGFLRFIIFSIRIKLVSSYNTTLGLDTSDIGFYTRNFVKNHCRSQRHRVPYVRYIRTTHCLYRVLLSAANGTAFYPDQIVLNLYTSKYEYVYVLICVPHIYIHGAHKKN
jgi:hypothetical protein